MTTSIESKISGLIKSSKVRAKQDVSDQEILAKAFERFDAVTHNSKGHEKFLDKRNSSRNAANRTPLIRDGVSYFLRGDVQARSAVQAGQRAEGAR
jgi:hypothetical protein